MRIKKFSKRINFLLVIIIGLIMLSINLSAMISSRIEGIVYDKETGKPIEGAEVYITGRKTPGHIEIKTDKEGRFVYDYIVEEGRDEFFVNVFKQGYASYGHAYDKKRARDAAPNSLGSIRYPDDKKWWTKIEEGDVKYFRIGLEKEAILEINISYKYPPQIKPIEQSEEIIEKGGHYVRLRHERYEQERSYEVYKQKVFRGLAPGMIEVKFYTQLIGWPSNKSKRVMELKPGKNVLNWVYDLTKGGVVYGKVEGCGDCDVYLYDMNNKYVRDAEVNDGYYLLGDIKPGKYILIIDNYDYYKPKVKKVIIELRENEKKEVNFNY